MRKHTAILIALVTVIIILPFSAFSADEIIIDDGMPGFEVISGDWTASSAGVGYNGKSSRWATGNKAEARWTPASIEAGNYRVSVWKPVHQNNTDKQIYSVVHKGKMESFTVDVKNGEASWEILGVFEFDGLGNEFVSATKPQGGDCMRVDAVKWEKTTDAPGSTGGTVSDAPPPLPEPVSLDVTPTGNFENNGKWEWDNSVKGPIKAYPQVMFTNEVNASAVYSPEIKSANKVRISVFKIAGEGKPDTKASYEVKTETGSKTVAVDCTAGDDWSELGAFDFSGNGTETVTLTKTSEGVRTYASAVKFEILNDNQDVSDNVKVWQTLYVNVGTILKNEVQATGTFSDLEGHWSRADVETMAARGYIKGIDEERFAPDANLTRAEFTTLLSRALALNEDMSSIPFGDVGTGEWFYGYIAAAAKAGIFKGLPVIGGAFRPNSPITREDIALMLDNSAKITAKNTNWIAALPDKFDAYSDKDEISAYAADAMRLTVRTGILNGYSQTELGGKRTASRAEAAVLLKRFLQTYVWAGPPVSSEWEITFQDEFFGDSLNWDVWSSANDYSPHILSGRWKENAVVEDGLLKLVTKKEDRGGAQWSSALVFTRDSAFTQAYGYWEARYRYAAATGLNQSFWMSGYNGTPDFFELDINEGHYPNILNMSLHAGQNDAGVKDDNSKRYEADEDLSADFHTYAVEWNEKELIYYFDGKEVERKNAYNAQKPCAIKLATAVLNWAGPVTDDLDSKSMDVDYVRIYSQV
jgi:beta-glucanase (GH16 family)